MQNDIIENFQKMSQLTLENFKKLGETNLRISERLLQEQVELANAIFETAAENAETVAEAKDFKDVATWQTECAQECTKKIIESSRNCAEIVAEAGKVYTNLFETGLKSAGNVSVKGGKGRKAA
jgi:phasin family protein